MLVVFIILRYCINTINLIFVIGVGGPEYFCQSFYHEEENCLRKLDFNHLYLDIDLYSRPQIKKPKSTRYTVLDYNSGCGYVFHFLMFFMYSPQCRGFAKGLGSEGFKIQYGAFFHLFFSLFLIIMYYRSRII